MVLTNKQKDDLHAAILGYLKSKGMDAAAEAFVADAGLASAAVDAKAADVLEKKWTAIVRLQRKILQLEQQTASLQEDLRLYGRGEKLDKTEALPREPAKLTLEGHRGPVTRVVFHPVYSLVVTASEDSTMRVYDYETGGYERSLKGHTDAVTDVAFAADGAALASASADLTIKLWDADKGKCVRTLKGGHDHTISAVAFMPGGSALLSASRDKTVKMWEISSGYVTKTFKNDAWVRCVQASGDGSLIAAGCMDHTVNIFSAASGELVRTLRDHDHVIEAVAFTTSARAEKLLREVMASDRESAASSAPAAAGGGDDSKDGDEAVVAGAFLATASRDKTIRIFEVATGRCVSVLEGHQNWVRGLAFHPSGRYLISCGDDKSVRVWDLSKNCRLSRTLEGAHPLFVSTLAWNRTSPLLATGGVDGTAKVWSCR